MGVGRNTAVAGQGKGRGRAGQGSDWQGQGKGSGRAGCLWRPFFPVAPEKGTLGAHKKRAGITYLTYMVVAPLGPGWGLLHCMNCECTLFKYLIHCGIANAPYSNISKLI